ncbi:unnamed protein product [Moneuplotes crassus]|uniref:Cell division cycle protein 123 n=1 Tax=Euplotes crassus TaxID=5936 RepID=A0AAD2CXN8_EUPCR|nr:unnamed protein product [Moneuplotes crassus]
MVDNCQIQCWYPQFKKITFKVKIIELPSEFRNYLEEDGVFMPQNYYVEDDQDSNSDEESIESEDKTPKYDFSALEEEIKATVDEYDEKVFIKLNWSAPRDANWLVPNLHCESTQEIYSLLKSSVFISHDVSAAYQGCVDHEGNSAPEKLYLALKKYHHNVRTHRENEFRCFVKENTLICVTQRDTQVYYPSLETQLEQFKPLILDFFNDHLQGHFADPSFVFDIYIDIPPNNKVWLVDFNPWHSKTDPGLLDWSEVMAHPTSDPVEWRIITEETGVRANEMSQYKVPAEIVEAPNSDEVKQFFDDMRGATSE